jgi:hypothetical protein
MLTLEKKRHCRETEQKMPAYILNIPLFSGGNSEMHLRKYYGKLLKAFGAKENRVTQADIHHHDKYLFNSLKGRLFRKGKTLKDLVPPKIEKRTHEEVEEIGKSIRIQIGGVKYDFSKKLPTEQEINNIMSTLQSIKVNKIQLKK